MTEGHSKKEKKKKIRKYFFLNLYPVAFFGKIFLYFPQLKSCLLNKSIQRFKKKSFWDTGKLINDSVYVCVYIYFYIYVCMYI